MAASDLYESNKKFCTRLSDGYMLKREDPKQKDILIELVDYSALGDHRKAGFGLDSEDSDVALAADVLAKYSADHNIIKFVNQLEIVGPENENLIIPVEVKSGKNIVSTSMKNYASRFDDITKLRVRFSMKNLALDENVLNIPLYLANQAKRLIALAIEKWA